MLSLLLEARDEDGQPLTDGELRDELLSLVLAGHETTANSLAWTFERLLRTPRGLRRACASSSAREDRGGAEYVEATIHEGMRERPVIPMIVRMVKRPWRLGEYVVPARTPVAVSIVALHHREDVYPDPSRSGPSGSSSASPARTRGSRSVAASGAASARRWRWPSSEVVLEAIARRTDLRAPDPRPSAARSAT